MRTKADRITKATPAKIIQADVRSILLAAGLADELLSFENQALSMVGNSIFCIAIS